MTEILDKTKEWSDRFGGVLRASAKTQYPHLYKGAVGGIEHVISVDNGGYYMELWRSGGDNYYATTGAAIKPLPGLAKGARLDEALDRFFTLMAKVEKDLDRPAPGPKRRPPTAISRPGYGPPLTGKKKPDYKIERAIPKKAKRLLHLRGEQKALPKKVKRLLGLKKRVMEKVDPEIGPSKSVGIRKPSDLSPESGVSKLAKRMIRNLVGEPTAQMRKNVVALTAPGGVGNQPGSGRVKPGTPSKTYQSPQGFSGRRMGGPGSKSPDAGTAGTKPPRVRKGGTNLGQKTRRRPAPYVGSRPAGAGSPLLRRGRKIDDITGGRVGEGGKITPVKPSKGGPGQPTGYGSTGMPQYSYGRKAAKGCGCGPAAEVRKAVRAVQ